MTSVVKARIKGKVYKTAVRSAMFNLKTDRAGVAEIKTLKRQHMFDYDAADILKRGNYY